VIAFEIIKALTIAGIFLSFLLVFPMIWFGMLRLFLKAMANETFPHPFDFSAKNYDRIASLVNKSLFVDTKRGWPKVIERLLMVITFLVVLLALAYGLEHIVHIAIDLPKSQFLRDNYG